MSRALQAGLCLALFSGCQAPSPPPDPEPLSWRIATFDVSLGRPRPGQLARELQVGDQRARQVAAILQRVRPSVVLLNGFDYDPEGVAIRRFVEDYLKTSQDGAPPIHYRDVFTAEVNRALPDGSHPGHYGMAILSNLEINLAEVRSFRELRWRQMPDHSIPPGRFGDDELAELRLSTTSHWDVPVLRPDGSALHLLASHPTAPDVEDPEGLDGRRNHDEIRFWADYIEPARSKWIVDDHGIFGGLPEGDSFVILGNLEVDPHDGASFQHAARQLTEHPGIDARRAPTSLGAIASARLLGGRNATQVGDPGFDTCEATAEIGNLRLDYALPSTDLQVESGGVYWPVPEEADHRLIESTDHRLVWIDLL